MAIGRRKSKRQRDFWVAKKDLPQSKGHAFYRKLNELLREAEFDKHVESICEEYYHDTIGRPGIPPGTYFRMLMAGWARHIGKADEVGAQQPRLKRWLLQKRCNRKGRSQPSLALSLSFSWPTGIHPTTPGRCSGGVRCHQTPASSGIHPAFLFAFCAFASEALGVKLFAQCPARGYFSGGT